MLRFPLPCGTFSLPRRARDGLGHDVEVDYEAVEEEEQPEGEAAADGEEEGISSRSAETATQRPDPCAYVRRVHAADAALMRSLAFMNAGGYLHSNQGTGRPELVLVITTYPNGGMRATHTAGGYLAVDPISPPFVPGHISTDCANARWAGG